MKTLIVQEKQPLFERLNFQQANMVCEFDDSPQRDLFMKGIFIQGGVRNLNERIYPVEEITRAVEQVMQQIHGGIQPCGEADHPAELNINLDRISHVITQMWMDGPNGMGKLKIVPTPMGNIVRTLLESGVKLGVSSRGSGNVDDRGYVSEFEIVTVDIVVRPSAPEAYPKVVYEAYNDRRGRVTKDLAESVRHDPKAQRHLKTEILSWIDRLRA